MTTPAPFPSVGPAWRGLWTSCVSDALDSLDSPGQALGIRCVGPGGPVAGPAFTVRYLPASKREGTVGDFIDDVPPGSVIVLDNGGRRDVTVWGGILTLHARNRGVRAAVIHGMCRDVSSIRALGFPVFARGNTMRTGKDRVRAVECGGPVSLGAVSVSCGDIVVADADGVVVVPKAREPEVLAAAAPIAASERRIEIAVQAGERLAAARIRHGYHALQRGPGSDPAAGAAADAEDAGPEATIGSAAASDALGEPRVLSPRLVRLSGRGIVSGPAATAVCRADSNLPLHEALDAARPGCVLVASTDDAFIRGSWGGLMTRAAIHRGLAGLVLQGHVRDVAEIRSSGFPVWAIGTSPAASGKARDGAPAIGVSVRLDGVCVRPGDWIVADDDGVCVIPAGSRDAVLRSARRRVRAEDAIVGRIHAGDRLLDCLAGPRGTKGDRIPGREDSE